ncbi:MAG: hypothetical protein ABII06_14945 [Pseudomonadota bacterium]
MHSPINEKMKISGDIQKCYGCRTCELACSFHHEGVFALSLSSIKISRSNLTGKMGWKIDSTCDSCVGEDQPLCVKYCAYGAINQGTAS